jgi:putative colanic acid biosynthesis acetyltransferase WcaF
MTLLDAERSRPLKGGASYSYGHRLTRLFWSAIWLLAASWTPAPMHRWRIWLLRRFGAEVHSTAHIYGSVRVWYPRNLQMKEHSCLGPRVSCYSMAPIRLGENAIVSQGAHLCAGGHDIDDSSFQLVVQPIVLERNAWVAAEAFIGPGVTVREGAVIGARAVVFKDADPWTVYVGNPARPLRARARCGG